MKKLLILTLIIMAGLQSIAQISYMLVGTYTSSGKSKGIHVYKFNSATGETTDVDSIATSNPSFVAVSPDEKFVYAVHEVGRANIGGEISSFSFNKATGKLTLLNKEPTGGDHPCYIMVDQTGKWVFAGNYTSGSLCVFPVNADGSLRPTSTFIQHTGSGANKERQASPHVHCTFISPDNKWLFVPDLGMDKVMVYSFDAATGKLTDSNHPYVARPGKGPRHFTFHPNGKYAYLVEELGGDVIAFHYKDGILKEMQHIGTIPDAATGYPGCADIHVSPDGKFLYATNRGVFNTIASYKIDPATGMLTTLNYQSTAGKSPRNFNIDPSGNFLLVANQETDEIVVFKRNKETGELTDSGKRIAVGQPVCIKWIAD